MHLSSPRFGLHHMHAEQFTINLSHTMGWILCGLGVAVLLTAAMLVIVSAIALFFYDFYFRLARRSRALEANQ